MLQYLTLPLFLKFKVFVCRAQKFHALFKQVHMASGLSACPNEESKANVT